MAARTRGAGSGQTALGKGHYVLAEAFVEQLVGDALETFDLTFFLGDKGYLSDDVLAWLWAKGLKAAIPVKKRWNEETKSHCPEAAKALFSSQPWLVGGGTETRNSWCFPFAPVMSRPRLGRAR